mgnify:CR=1 FL=1
MSGWRKALSIVIVALQLAALWPGVISSTVEANGQTAPILETTLGPYRVEISVSPATPRVGNLHMVIVLWTVEGREPVNNASVRVSALGPAPESMMVDPIETFSVAPTLNSYDLNIPLHQEGEWGFIVDITENDRLTRVEFPLNVESGGIYLGLGLVLIAAVPLLVAVAWYARKSFSGDPSGVRP